MSEAAVPGTSPSAETARAWFLQRGLPGVLSRRDRSRHLLSRSLPLIAAYDAFILYPAHRTTSRARGFSSRRRSTMPWTWGCDVYS